MEVEILSSNGRPVYQQSVVAGNEMNVSTTNWATGIYWVRCLDAATGQLLGAVPLKVSR